MGATVASTALCPAGLPKERLASHISANDTSYPTGVCHPDFRLQPIAEIPSKALLKRPALSIYRKIFALVFIVNLSVLIALCVREFTRGRGLTYYSTVTSASVNLLVSIGTRNEHVVNVLFRLSTSVPQSAPLWVRCLIAKVYGIGGLHSGAAMSAIFWYTAFACLATHHAFKPPMISPVLLTTTYSNLSLLVLISAFAYPKLRSRLHNWFEATHRFAGWAAVILLWTQCVLMASISVQQADDPYATLSHELLISPTFWCLTGSTLCVVYPWLRLRKRPVVAERLSSHAIRLHFTHMNVDMGQAMRFGDNPLKETHPFALIRAAAPVAVWPSSGSPSPCNSPTGEQKYIYEKGFSVIISRAGDWTSRIIDCPPSHIYIRGGPTYGVLRIATMFKPVLMVATGSGIAPCLSLFRGKPDLVCRILWTTPSPLETYGEGIVNEVRRADRDAVIVDTRKSGRPDLVALSCEVYMSGKCEAALVVSNAGVTVKTVYGLEARGIPAFGPIFDS